MSSAGPKAHMGFSKPTELWQEEGGPRAALEGGADGGRTQQRDQVREGSGGRLTGLDKERT